MIHFSYLFILYNISKVSSLCRNPFKNCLAVYFEINFFETKFIHDLSMEISLCLSEHFFSHQLQKVAVVCDAGFNSQQSNHARVMHNMLMPIHNKETRSFLIITIIIYIKYFQIIYILFHESYTINFFCGIILIGLKGILLNDNKVIIS